MLPLDQVPSGESNPVIGRTAAEELQYRMNRPQRHRLLHGYPQAIAMHSAREVEPDLDLLVDSKTKRELLIGVLPHPFCNPAVTGCGFCTFPHESGNSARTEEVVEAVKKEMLARFYVQLAVLGDDQPVTGLYFGGGTANLTAPQPFRELCKELASGWFDFSAAEVTLEGVPAQFLKKPRLIEILRDTLPARHYRISMGIQSFAEGWLRRMGRLAFGTASTFRQVVDLAHSLGFTVSADLLFNLPGQQLAQMKDDLRQAIDLGLDHLGLYHLVLFEKLGTPWASDPELLAGLPSNEHAADNWQSLREMLLADGFYQTTLTNFERVSFRGQANRFVYEECSFQPDRFDILGFGPSAISYVADAEFQHGIKTLNPTGAKEYLQATKQNGHVWDHYFVYEPADQRIGYLTRRLSALEISRGRYRELFSSDPLADFAEECAALVDAGLLSFDETSIRPTPQGMFYADSIAALWAWRRIRSHRAASHKGEKPRLPGHLTIDRSSVINESGGARMG